MGEIILAEDLLASQEGLRSVESDNLHIDFPLGQPPLPVTEQKSISNS